MIRLAAHRIVMMLAPLMFALSVPGAVAARGKPVALPSSPAVVVIAPVQPSPSELESEAYGDWANYLNEFVGSKPPGLLIVRMSPARWRSVANAPRLKDVYATVFLRRGGRALIHQGKVLEVQVYHAGADWMRGRRVADLPAMGLTESRVVRRR